MNGSTRHSDHDRGTAHPHRAHYGWVMVAIAPVFMSMGSGSLWSLALFLRPILTEFGWLRGQTALAFTAGTVALGLGGLVMGRLADRMPTRRIVLLGTGVLGGCNLLLAGLTNLGELYLFYCLLGGLGSAALWAPLLNNVGNWFEARKGLALGLTLALSGLANAAQVKLCAWLIEQWGWQGAYQLLGIGVLLGMLPLALLVRDAPREAATGTPVARVTGTGSSARPAPGSGSAPGRTPDVVTWLGVAAFFCCVSFSTNLVHLAALVQDRGFSAEEAATVLLLVFLASVAGRAGFGVLADVWGGVGTFLLSAVGQAALVFWFTRIGHPIAFATLALVYGFVYSGAMTSLMIAVRSLLPLADRGWGLGRVNLFGWIGNGLGAWQAGTLFDHTGSYTLPYALAAGAGVLASIVLAALVLRLRAPAVGASPLAAAGAA